MTPAAGPAREPACTLWCKMQGPEASSASSFPGNPGGKHSILQFQLIYTKSARNRDNHRVPWRERNSSWRQRRKGPAPFCLLLTRASHAKRTAWWTVSSLNRVSYSTSERLLVALNAVSACLLPARLLPRFSLRLSIAIPFAVTNRQSRKHVVLSSNKSPM